MGFLRLPMVRKPRVGSGAVVVSSLIVEMGGCEAKWTSFLGGGAPRGETKLG